METDNYAYRSALRDTEPARKTVFSLTTLIICISGNSPVLSLFIFFTMVFIILVINRTPWKVLLRMLKAPMVFLLIGVLTLALDISSDKSVFLRSVHIGKFFIGTTGEGLRRAVILFLKSMSSVTCLYFLSLSTPLTDILSVMKKAHIPPLFTEIMSLVYRFIFIIMESIGQIYTAQDSRLGYVSLTQSFKSMASLISSCLIKSLKKSNDFYTSLEARGYTGTLNVLPRTYSRNRKLTALFILADSAALIILIISRTTGLF